MSSASVPSAVIIVIIVLVVVVVSVVVAAILVVVWRRRSTDRSRKSTDAPVNPESQELYAYFVLCTDFRTHEHTHAHFQID